MKIAVIFEKRIHSIIEFFFNCGHGDFCGGGAGGCINNGNIYSVNSNKHNVKMAYRTGSETVTVRTPINTRVIDIEEM